MNESDRQSDPLLGRTLGGVYAVERRLGTGGFGAVYAGRHLRTGRRYALKVLRPDRALVSPEARERFRREAEALASLGHAGIVAVHDYASSDGFDYLVMDLLEGEDLASRLAAGPLPLSEALRIVEQIADALSLAHHQGIVHRDLKPANVFLARERTPSSDAHRASQLSDESTERAVLLDFGLAKSTGGGPSLTASGEALGTPQYMAPEQASGDHIDARTDVYALGAILFEMLSGHPPFDGPSPAAVLVKSLTTPAPSLRGTPGVPSHVADAVAHALAKEPDLRPASATDFVAYLRAERPESLVPETRAMPVVGARSTERPPPTRVSDAQPMSRPFPWLAVSIATIAVCIVGVLAYVATRPGETDLPTAARAPSNEAPSNEAPSNEAPSNEAPSNEAPSNEAPSNEAPSNEAPSNEAPAELGAPPLEPTPDPHARPRASRPPRRLTPTEDRSPSPAPTSAAPDMAPTSAASSGALRYDPAAQRATILGQAEELESRAANVDTLFPPMDRIRQGLAPLLDGREPTFCGRDVGLPRGGDDPNVVNTSQNLRGMVERACEPFERLRNPPPELINQIRDLLDRDIPRGLVMARETSSSNQPVEVAREVEAALLEAQRLVEAVVAGRQTFACDAPVWGRLRRASDAGNSWAGAAADRALNPRNRICSRLRTTNEHLVTLGRNLNNQLDSVEGSMRQVSRQYRSTALQLRASANQLAGTP